MSAIRKIAEITDLEVKLISFVDKGANKRELIWKGSGEKPNVEFNVEIKKIDEELREVYCQVYVPNETELDTHEEYMTAPEIKKAAHKYMKRSNMHSIDEQHNLEVAKDVYVVESWIIKNGDELFPKDVGGWAVCIKVENDEVWEKIKKGEYTGLSLYGTGKKIEKKSTLVKSDIVVKDFNESFAKLELENTVRALCNALWDAVYNYGDGWSKLTRDEQLAELTISAEQFLTKLEEIKSTGSIAKAGKTLSQANMDKLVTASESIKSVLEAAGAYETKKTEILEKNKSQGENKLTKEEIEKAAGDAAADAVKKAVEPITAEIEVLKADKVKLETELSDLKKTSTGSKQTEDLNKDTDKKPVKKGMFVNAPAPVK